VQCGVTHRQADRGIRLLLDLASGPALVAPPPSTPHPLITPTRSSRAAAGSTANTKTPVMANAAGYPNADLYQLLAYCTLLGLPAGHLVYTRGNADPARHMVRGQSPRRLA